jgi:Ca2+-binding EF-hand superfamily protein
MFSEADKNDDGKMDFDEFVAMMLPTATAVSQ